MADEPKYLTHEDLNGALAAQKRDFDKMLKQQTEQNKAFMESIQGAFSPNKAEPATIPTKSELAEDTLELKRQLKILMERDRQRDETEKRVKLETSLRSELNKHGIRSRDEIAVKYLNDQVSYDETGNLVMKAEIAPGVIQPLSLSEAVAKFAQSEHGKFLADPKDVRGSGANSMNAPRNFSQPNITTQMTGNGEVPVFKDAKSMQQYATAMMDKGNLKY